MNECLVTRLKATVNDAELPYFGAFVFSMPQNIASVNESKVRIVLEKSGAVAEIISGNFCFDNSLDIDYSTTTKDISTNPNIFVSQGSVVKITPKYEMKSFEAANLSFDLKSLKFANSLVTFYCIAPNITGGELKSFANNNVLSVLNLGNSRKTLKGHIADLSGCTNLTSIIINVSEVDGVIASIGRLTKLNELNIADTKISGSIEDFVSMQIASGRVSGTIKFPYPKTLANVTYKGVSLSNSTDITNNSGTSSFSWNSNGEISWT